MKIIQTLVKFKNEFVDVYVMAEGAVNDCAVYHIRTTKSDVEHCGITWAQEQCEKHGVKQTEKSAKQIMIIPPELYYRR